MDIKKYEDFIKILKVILPIYKKNKSNKAMKAILSLTVRRLEHVSEKCVSVAAQQKAKDLGIMKELTEFSYDQQVTKTGMNDSGRKKFHFEHYYPVKQLINELLEIKNLNDEDIYQVVKKSRICWITKDENKKLDRKYKSIRPNPKKAYEEAGIILVEEA
ncbi:MAG: hypothetical protein K8Q99_06795 [Acholeplasmataceae bacterium]|nr:hypothetical protein [Acholeplasmataceae bacterium]